MIDLDTGESPCLSIKNLIGDDSSIPTRRGAVMNLKCYKSVILASTFFLMLTERLKKLQQAAQIAACCNILVRPGL
jgi:hypothetical protein